jgi:hypothetical protein
LFGSAFDPNNPQHAVLFLFGLISMISLAAVPCLVIGSKTVFFERRESFNESSSVAAFSAAWVFILPALEVGRFNGFFTQQYVHNMSTAAFAIVAWLGLAYALGLLTTALLYWFKRQFIVDYPHL